MPDFLAKMFPRWALGRAQARALLRLYEAAHPKQFRPVRGGAHSPDAVVDDANDRIRRGGRWLDENNPYAIAVLDEIVQSVVGTGVEVEPMVRREDGVLAAEFNDAIKQAREVFWEAPEATGELPGPEVERLVLRSQLRDGEIFIRHHVGQDAPHTAGFGYALELLEADYCPFTLIGSSQAITGQNLVHGIEHDQWGRPTVFHFHTSHPGDSFGLGTTLSLETVPVPAADVTHLKFARRVGQTRGISILSGVITALMDLGEYHESERVAARVAAAMTGFIRKNMDFSGVPAPSDGKRRFRLSPGMIFDDLLPGEDIGTIDTKRPNEQFSAFTDALVRSIAAGTGTRYSPIARDYNGTYSAQRQELVENSVAIGRLVSYQVHKFYRSVHRRMVDVGILNGMIPNPNAAAINRRTLYKIKVVPPNIPWIDPLKEVNALRVAWENGFMSKNDVIRALGGNPGEVEAEIESETPDMESGTVNAPRFLHEIDTRYGKTTN